MPLLPLDQLTIGMVIDSDVKDRSGRLLLRAGVELSERTLKVLRTWGIAGVSVAGGEEAAQSAEPPPVDLPPHIEAAARERVDDLFRHVDRGHPVAALLAQRVQRLLARQLFRGEGG